MLITCHSLLVKSAEKTLKKARATKIIVFHVWKKVQITVFYHGGSLTLSENRHYTEPHREQSSLPKLHTIIHKVHKSLSGGRLEKNVFLIGEFNISYWIICQTTFSFHASLNQSSSVTNPLLHWRKWGAISIQDDSLKLVLIGKNEVFFIPVGYN